jgi:DNA-directed RNA polymerase subunit RPC12/RpoP
VTTTALTCPACGANLEYDGVSPTVRCTFCGNNIIVSSQAVPQGGTQSAQETKDEAFAEQVRLLVELGETDQAVGLLGQQLSIPPADAKQVVALFEAGNYGNEAQIIKDVLRRRGG